MTSIAGLVRYFGAALTLTLTITIGGAHASPSKVTIKSQDKVVISSTIISMTVEVTINTHELQIGNASDKGPSAIQSSCTYSRYPCRLVDSIDIAINGSALFIPRSVFCDLADLSNAEIKEGRDGIILALYGGDASESYVVEIEFDENSVKRRTLSSSLLPDQPLQETTYHVRTLGVGGTIEQPR